MSIFNLARKIDNAITSGLLGIRNSLAYRVHEIEKHVHNSEFWYGDDGDNSMSRANNLTAWRLTAGLAGVYGTEVQLGAANDFLVDMANAVKVDCHKIKVPESSVNDKNYIVQFFAGETTFAEADFLTEVPYRTGGSASESQPISVLCPRFSVACKIWARVKCETGSATIDILIGLHGYVG